ncbi:hypothetical protein [Aminiphilus sp.]|uniref:hypothetical protein n=1 Tax=Aminiphilus sp. TaxID=1872488 RepID=UPI002610CA1A|nr:hypothetical protein [Aminiphilus sp.]
MKEATAQTPFRAWDGARPSSEWTRRRGKPWMGNASLTKEAPEGLRQGIRRLSGASLDTPGYE